MIEWMKRCKREDNKYAERRSWYTVCKLYKIEESNIRYGRGKDKNGNLLGYPISYRAMVKRRVGGWYILSENKTFSAAKKVVEYYAENGKMKPKPKKRRRKVK